MENDFTPSKQYFTLWNEAKKIKNIDKLDALFRELASEVGLTDPASTAAQAEAGRKIAEYLNNRGKGSDCKVI